MSIYHQIAALLSYLIVLIKGGIEWFSVTTGAHGVTETMLHLSNTTKAALSLVGVVVSSFLPDELVDRNLTIVLMIVFGWAAGHYASDDWNRQLRKIGKRFGDNTG